MHYPWLSIQDSMRRRSYDIPDSQRMTGSVMKSCKVRAWFSARTYMEERPERSFLTTVQNELPDPQNGNAKHSAASLPIKILDPTLGGKYCIETLHKVMNAYV